MRIREFPGLTKNGELISQKLRNFINTPEAPHNKGDVVDFSKAAKIKAAKLKKAAKLEAENWKQFYSIPNLTQIKGALAPYISELPKKTQRELTLGLFNVHQISAGKNNGNTVLKIKIWEDLPAISEMHLDKNGIKMEVTYPFGNKDPECCAYIYGTDFNMLKPEIIAEYYNGKLIKVSKVAESNHFNPGNVELLPGQYPEFLNKAPQPTKVDKIIFKSDQPPPKRSF